MHVTFVGPVPPLRSGIAQHGGYLAEAFRDEHEVTVLSWQHQYPKLLFRRAQRDPRAPSLRGARFVLRWWDPMSWWRAGRVARGTDVLVFPWTTPFHAVAFRVLTRVARPGRVVAVVHNATTHDAFPLQRSLSRWVLGRCDGLVCHAAAVADELERIVGPTEVVVTPMPPHLEVAVTPLPPRSDVRLLFFGFVRPYKGLDVALDALALLRRRGVRVRLTVAGEVWGPVGEWHDRIAAAGLTDQVDMQARYVPDDEVSGLLAEHHAIVLPYRSASQSGIVPVALAAGRPVIATAVGGIPEVVSEGFNGCLAAPGDADSLAAAIERCLDNLDDLAAGATEHTPRWSEVAGAVVKAAGATGQRV